MRLVEGRSLLGTISLLIAAGLITVVQADATLDDGLLSFEQRVGCQRAIEEVYWQHRIWPAANPGPKPALDEVLPDAVPADVCFYYLVHSTQPNLGSWGADSTGMERAPTCP